MTEQTETYSYDAEASRYEARRGDRVVGTIDIVERDGVATLTHTNTDPELQGQGIASNITRFALDDLRERGLKVVPQCSYAVGWIERHPEYAELLA
ncbi:GNAT family N-acetyltransferase [Mariniluteicoccus endophyticus]